MLTIWLFEKMRCKSLLWPILTSLTLVLAGPAEAALDWTKSPSEAAWKSFVRLPLKKKASLWNNMQKQKISFDSLAWEWRLGWVRACAASNEAWCSILLQQGLFDRALVVRAETAARLGDRFAGTGHLPALRLLSTAYAVQQNRRVQSSKNPAQEPLFVQFRILHAIKQIGGNAGIELGERLAKGTQGTAHYWNLLARDSSDLSRAGKKEAL